MTIPTTTMRLDETTKQQAREILEELGLNISSATNLFLRAVVRTGGIPFNLKLDVTEPTSAGMDFVADFLAPLMSERNEIIRVNSNTDAIRRRLARRAELINRGRRRIA